jgi:hypothetical protein
MERTTIDPMQLLGMTSMDIETIVKLMLESRGIDSVSNTTRDPTEEEIEEMWNHANGSKNV